MKKSFLMFVVLFSVTVCGAANAGKESLPGIMSLLLRSVSVCRMLPDTGQTEKYSVIFGEDSDYTINPPSYNDNGNGTVIDNVTCLMWQQANAVGSATYNWYQAAGMYDATFNPTTQDVCVEQATGGHLDWRLPTKKELMGIVNYGRDNPSIDPIFTGTLSDHWSSTTYASDPGEAWVVGFSYGDASNSLKSAGNKYVRCVRGGQ